MNEDKNLRIEEIEYLAPLISNEKSIWCPVTGQKQNSRAESFLTIFTNRNIYKNFQIKELH